MFMLDEGIKVVWVIQKVVKRGFYKETQSRMNRQKHKVPCEHVCARRNIKSMTTSPLGRKIESSYERNSMPKFPNDT
jgi:hypothetical protein